MQAQVLGGPAEIQATSQEVVRPGDGTVRVTLAPPCDAPRGHWRLRLAEPVSVAAGERLIVRTGWPDVDAASRMQQPLTVHQDATVDAVFG